MHKGIQVAQLVKSPTQQFQLGLHVHFQTNKIF